MSRGYGADRRRPLNADPLGGKMLAFRSRDEDRVITESALTAHPPGLALKLVALGPACAVVGYALFLLGAYLAAGAPAWAYLLTAAWVLRAALFLRRVATRSDTRGDLVFAYVSFLAALGWIIAYHLLLAA